MWSDVLVFMKLKELVDGNFTALPGFLQAAASEMFIEGRDNVGIYALPGSRRACTLIDVYAMHGFGEIFEKSAQQMIAEDSAMENSVLIRGPLNNDAVLDTWLAVKYFLDNATDFKRVEGCDSKGLGKKVSWDYQIQVTIPGNVEDDSMVVAKVADDNYSISYTGPLRGDKFFRFGMCRNPAVALPGILSHINDFNLSTYDHVDGCYAFNKEDNWDVHLNGPADNPIMKDLLILGEAIRDYCIERCE